MCKTNSGEAEAKPPVPCAASATPAGLSELAPGSAGLQYAWRSLLRTSTEQKQNKRRGIPQCRGPCLARKGALRDLPLREGNAATWCPHLGLAGPGEEVGRWVLTPAESRAGAQGQP